MDTQAAATMPPGIDALVARQRQAILARDPAALDESTRALDAGLRMLGEQGAAAGAIPREALERLRAGLRLNAELLARAQAANARALAALFDADGLYRPGGESGLAQASRPLRTA
jgi:hypothetical protein